MAVKKRALELKRPLAFIDLETTGTFPELDRIVEIAILKVVRVDGKPEEYHTLVNPEMPIPPEASEMHGIRDEDVRQKPTFAKIARTVARMLEQSDLAGYYLKRFDLPLLQAEFTRAAVAFSLDDRKVVDVCRIFHHHEPRDLRAAYRFYCGQDLAEAHSAMADAQASYEVLQAQLNYYPDLPRDLARLNIHPSQVDPDQPDSGGWFHWRHAQPAFTRGKYKGLLLRDVAKEAPDYLEWMLQQSLPGDTEEIVQNALRGKFPRRKT